MPKDPTKNVDRYKIRGGQLNEFEYTENQGALAGQKPNSQANLIPGTPPEERQPQITKKAAKTTAKKSAKKATKATKSNKSKSTKSKGTGKSAKGRSKKSTKTVATRGASAKKLAARKAAKNAKKK